MSHLNTIKGYFFMDDNWDNNQEVFSSENEILFRSRAVKEDSYLSEDSLRDEYNFLAERFEKLLNKAVKITRLGDSSQRKLIRLKDELQKKNGQIHSQNEKLEELVAMLKEASLTDVLTGLRNRRYISECMEEESETTIRAYQAGAMPKDRDILFLIMDIDHFKAVNDRYGHGAGDKVLLQFSEILMEMCRKADIAARWGGEEFLVVMRGSHPESAPLLAERIRAAIENHAFQIGKDLTIRCTCSIGFSAFPFFPGDPSRFKWSQVVDLADTALYAAKLSGRNAWVGIGSKPDSSPGVDSESIHDNVHSLIEAGGLHISSSLPIDNLVWPQTKMP